MDREKNLIPLVNKNQIYEKNKGQETGRKLRRQQISKKQ
jgi:uncharacterized C2H2 Zn-finger protein